MLPDSNATHNNVNTEIINTLIGYEENVKNTNKQLASKRLLAARRAIEKHHESRELQEILSDPWFIEET